MLVAFTTEYKLGGHELKADFSYSLVSSTPEWRLYADGEMRMHYRGEDALKARKVWLIQMKTLGYDSTKDKGGEL